jgi:acyl-CoA synthetase (AMP-forming)/AMP-acid ligase II
MDLGIQQQQARAADETDRPWGEAVKAVVEPNAGFKIDPAEIITFCRETLGGVKTPKTVEVLGPLAAQRQRQGSEAPNSGSILAGASASGLTATGCGHYRCRPEP